MSSERWERAEALFLELAPLSRREQRAAMQSKLGEEASVLRIVEDLLSVGEWSQSYLDEPARLTSIEGTPAGGAAEGLAPGERLGAYEILEEVGQGGMSAVYRARRSDAAYEQQVAVKVIRGEIAMATVVRRFQAERQILASLEHPNIARILDGGTTAQGLSYLVLEWVEGLPLDRYCAEHRLSIRQRLELFRKVLGAVSHAHRSLVVHRDLKPANILVTAQGEPKLLDFGIAKLLDPGLLAVEATVTSAWVRLLTPRYASPEQIRGEAVTTASDVYSLGVILYELLAGRAPFAVEGLSMMQLAEKLTRERPRPPSAVVQGSREHHAEGSVVAPSGGLPEGVGRALRGDLDAIVLQALREDPRRRYGSVELLDEDLRRHQAGFPIRARPDTWGYRTSRFLSRHRLSAALTGVLLALIVGLAATTALQTVRVTVERDEALAARHRAEQLLGFVQDVFQVSLEGEELTVRQAVSRSAASLDSKLLDQPRTRAELLEIIGNIYRHLGIYDLAQAQFEKALVLRRALSGPESSSVATLLGALGLVRGWQNELEEGEALIQQALSIARRDPQTGDAEMANLLNEWVSLLCLEGDFQQADQPSEQALTLARSSLDDLDVRKAQAFASRARVFTKTGRNGQAIPLYSEAVRLQRLAQGPDHPELGVLLNNLALAFRQEGNLDDAARLLSEAVALQRRLSGSHSPSAAATLKNLGDLQLLIGELEAAEASYVESRRMVEEFFGESHFAVLVNLAGLASVRLRQGRPAEAEALLRGWLERWGDGLQSRYLRGLGESVLGESLVAQGRFEEAGPLLLRSYEAILAQQGPESDKTLQARARLDAFYRASGQDGG